MALWQSPSPCPELARVLAIAPPYAGEGYTVVLVARRREPLEQLALDLASEGATSHIITANDIS